MQRSCLLSPDGLAPVPVLPTGNLPEIGQSIAGLLAGVWRSSPPPLRLSARTLEKLAPILLLKGCGALAWRRIRDSGLCDTAPGIQLHDAFRFHRIQQVLREWELIRAWKHLQSAGVEPLLAKGWAVARLYPEPGLRPFGDLDICVRPEQFETAHAALRVPDTPESAVELHRHFRELKHFTVEELFERSRLVPLHGTTIRILGPEDHLRLLCLHALHHGVWRPVWLCDIGLMLQSLESDFDWSLCAGGQSWYSQGVRCALLLAGQLLEADLEKVPSRLREKPLPRWFVPTVWREWGRPEHHMRGPGMDEYLLNPQGILRALRIRWPNGVQATFTVKAPFNNLPRLPFQLTECVIRLVRFLRTSVNFG